MPPFLDTGVQTDAGVHGPWTRVSFFDTRVHGPWCTAHEHGRPVNTGSVYLALIRSCKHVIKRSSESIYASLGRQKEAAKKGNRRLDI